MNIRLGRVQLHLETREVIRLHDPRGARVECLQGALWITQNKDRRDYFLAANDALTLDRPGLALIHAQEPSEIVLSEPPPCPRLRLGRTLLAALRAAGKGFARSFGPESIDRSGNRGYYGL